MSQLSSFKPTEAGKYAKNSLFQVYDKDSLDHTIAVKTATVSGLTTDVGVTYKPKATPVGYFKGAFPVTRFGVKGATIDFDLQTDASKASSVGVKQKAFLPQYVSGLSLGLKASTSDKDLSSAAKYRAFGGVTLDYARPNFVGQVAVTTDGDKQTMLTANASVGANGFSVGGDVKLVASGSSMTPKAYNVGAEYKKGAYVAALVSDAKFDKLKATFLTNRVAWKDATYNFGAQAKIDLQAPKTGAPQRELILSVEQVATPQTKYKLAYVATGNSIVAGVEHQPSPAFKLTATGVTSMPNSPFAPFTFTRFGVGAEWNLQQ